MFLLHYSTYEGGNSEFQLFIECLGVNIVQLSYKGLALRSIAPLSFISHPSPVHKHVHSLAEENKYYSFAQSLFHK